MDPNNHDRAMWAKAALDAFPACEAGQTVQNIEDLVTDLLHLVVAHGGDPKTVIRVAVSNFKEETREEAEALGIV